MGACCSAERDAPAKDTNHKDVIGVAAVDVVPEATTTGEVNIEVNMNAKQVFGFHDAHPYRI